MECVTQEAVNQKNKTFWNELCGTGLAKQLGVVDSSIESLKKFDDFYFDYYPYLKQYLALDDIKEKKVLEVGLGYGTVSQALALAGADYHGLDISDNAAAMANHRLAQHQLKGRAHVESMLECSFPDEYFDYVFAIGCFHHTGDLRACIDQTYRVLKSGGKACIMVYNKFSLRRWFSWPITTMKNLVFQCFGKSYRQPSSTEEQRKAYDASSAGGGAPHTDFFSKQELQEICSKFASTTVVRENFDEDFKFRICKVPLIKFGSRASKLTSRCAKWFGLDLYVQLVK